MDHSKSDTPPIHSQSRVQACPADIICGRGFHIVNHHGNHNLHIIVNKYQDLYQMSPRSQKTKIIKFIQSEIKRTGARFIRRVSDEHGAEEWQEVDDATAYKKVSHALRRRTKNETNRHNGTIPPTATLRRQGGDANIDPLRQLSLRLSSTTSVPPEVNPTSAYHRPSEMPDSADIICGRGLHIAKHRGNLTLHRVANHYRERYLKSPRPGKAKIIKHILDEIKSTGARFIRKVSDGQSAEKWEVVDDEAAYNKVSHALRLRTTNTSNRDNGMLVAAPKLNPLRASSGTGTLNQVGSMLSVPSDHPASLPFNVESPHLTVPVTECNPTVDPLKNMTTRNGPTAAPAAVLPLWVPQLPQAQLLRQQYFHFPYAMLQQHTQQQHP